MPFIPHTQQDVAEMLSVIGVDSIDVLFDEIPADLRISGLRDIPPALNEMALLRLAATRAEQDSGKLCFIGAGAYEHHIPAAVWEVATRGEFMTAYTPYQAEASQGTLQVLYEYQTMMARLMAMNVSNASLYDGASALAEAILMAMRLDKKNKIHRIVLPTNLHPHYRDTVHAIVRQRDTELLAIPFDAHSGKITVEMLEKMMPDTFTAFVIPQPNFFGVLEDIDTLTDWAHARGARVIAVVNPLAMALLKPPGQWGKKGADMACGEGQPLGVPLASGGPYYGFLCCRTEDIRQLPGRIAGRTRDTHGRNGFVLTLQAREQHIRRARATSNICTNQGLLVTASTIYMSIMGATGLRDVALTCHANARLLRDKLKAVAGIRCYFESAYFHEFLVQLNCPVDGVLTQLHKKNIQPGLATKTYYPELGECLLVCVTETKTPADIDYFIQQLICAM